MDEGFGLAGEQAGRAAFVGRGDELARLDAVLDGLGRGESAVVEVTGEAGIGKGRLVAELASRARARGMTVLRGRAAEYERHSPLRPFSDAFADLDASTRQRLPVLAELSSVLSGVGEVPSEGDAAGRFGLYQDTAAVLGRVGGAGLVMMLEDMHWADPASLELVDHLVRHPVPAPVLLVVSHRDRQAPPSLSATLTRGVDDGTVLRLALGPLSERDCVETLAGDLPPSVAAGFYEASNGNPLYFLALLKAHRETRPISVSPSAVPGGRDGLSAGLGALLLDELAPLSPLERRIVEAAAVLGDHTTTTTLCSLTDCGSQTVIEALSGLIRRDVIRREHGGRRLVLRHPLVRALVHEAIDPWRREELHRRAAGALAVAGASVMEQAHHVEQSLSGWDQQAADILVAAARQSAATAPATSAHWLGVVLRLLPDDPEHASMQGELTLLRARALAVSGRLKESRDLLHQVMDGTDGSGYDDLRTSAVTFCVRVERKLGRHPEAQALLRRELARRPGPTPLGTVRLGLELCSCAIAAARFPEVRADIAEVLRTARSLGDEIGEVAALTLFALGEVYEGETAAARALARSAAELVDAMTDNGLAELAEYLCVLGWTEMFLQHHKEAERHLDRGLEIIRRTGQVYLMPHFLTVRAHIHLDTCRITTALELAEESAEIARSLDCGDLLAFTLAFKAHVLLQARPAGSPDALSVAEEAVAACNSDTWWADLAACALAHAAFDSGDPHRAMDTLLGRGGDDELRHLQATVRPGHLELLVNAALATGRPEDAADWAERACKEADQLGLPAQRAAALSSLAQVAAHHGDSAEAGRLFAEAAELSARSGATLREAQCLLLAAPHRRATGDAADAAAKWHRGHHLAVEGGAHLLVGVAERIRPAVFGALVEPADELAALTGREREIADLVAEGLSSRAIADRLYLSPRTVESHIARIYRKTGVSSRAALASVVTRCRTARQRSDTGHPANDRASYVSWGGHLK
ncbi:AAA family ATPase [Streptomyces sp. NPDC050508]|uniref:helix-turn-helix transcriptional regulator n=1 Tax=Streptomyces sp. NPDC050508 TaxID=3155405 RepID=UPI003415BD4F